MLASHDFAASQSTIRLSLRRLAKTAAVLASVGLATACLAATPAIRVVSGANQNINYGSVFPAPLVVLVTDSATRQALPGIQVNFLPSSGVAVNAPSVLTDSSGKASVGASSLAAGTWSVTAQVASSPATTTSVGSLFVHKAPLTVVPTDLQSIVSQIPTPTDYYLKGFVHGDTAQTVAIAGAPVLTTTATASSPAGNYAILVKAGTLTAANYSFVSGIGKLNLVGPPSCGALGAPINSVLQGSYAFNLYDQQGGVAGTFSADGVSRLEGHSFFNQSTAASPTDSDFVGAYRVGVGDRGGAVLLQSSPSNPGATQISTLCLAVDSVVNGVATAGRLISVYGASISEAGSFYLSDGTASSVASFNGSYVLGLQGTKLDVSSGNPLQNVATILLKLDGKGNVTGTYRDVDHLIADGNNPIEQYNQENKINGSYTYDPAQGDGAITITFHGISNYLRFVAPTNKHLLAMTQDNGVTVSGNAPASTAVYFGEGWQQAPGPFSVATMSGNTIYLAQGVDTYGGFARPYAQAGSGLANALNAGPETRGDVSRTQALGIKTDTKTASEGLVVEMGGFWFDGAGTMTEQGQFTVTDRNAASIEDATGKGSSFAYTVDPTTGRFESRDAKTNACILCGFLIGPNQLYGMAPGSGTPLLITLHGALAAPGKLKLSDLNGKYSTGTMSLISPLIPAFEGIMTFDGKGNFQWAADYDSMSDILVSNARFFGTYTVTDGAYCLSVIPDTICDFYVYMDSVDHGTLISYDLPDTSIVPLLTFNAVTPKAAK